VIWSIVDFSALTNRKTIYPVISLIPGVICTGILLYGAAVSIAYAVYQRGNLLNILVAILVSFAG